MPIGSLTIKELKQQLNREIIGQEQAMEEILQVVAVALMGVSDLQRPLGSFLLLGPTGVGKSQTGRSLAKIIHGDERKAITINCTEFSNPHDVAKLVGAPPGYVGFEHPPFLAPEMLTENFTILVFEELEKADRTFFNLLLPVLERAELKTGRSHNLCFNHCFILMTSNLGSYHYDASLRGQIGFCSELHDPITPEEALTKRENVFLTEARRHLPPEFLNRFDEIITFKRLGEKELFFILEKFLLEMRARWAARGLEMSLTEKAKNFLIQRGTDFLYGARPLRKAIRRYLEFPLVGFWSERRQLSPSEFIQVDLARNEQALVFEVKAAKNSFNSRQAQV